MGFKSNMSHNFLFMVADVFRCLNHEHDKLLDVKHEEPLNLGFEPTNKDNDEVFEPDDKNTDEEHT